MYFVVRNSANGQYYFVIKAANHEVVATSETYYLKESAIKTINSLKTGIDSGTLIVDMTE